MPTTFLQLKTKVSVRLKDPDNIAVGSSNVGMVINDAIKQYKKKRLWFNEFMEDVTLVVDDPILPALGSGITILDLFKRDGIVIKYSNYSWTVEKVLPIQYDSMNVNGRGIPFAYTYRDGQFELYYYPSADYTATVRGLKDYADLSGDSDTNDWLEYAEDLIMYESLSRLYGEFRQDPKMEAYYSARAEDQYKRLIAYTNKQNKSGKILIEDF